MSKYFNIGALTATEGIREVMSNSQAFKEFVNRSLERYFVGDWGETPEDVAERNNRAVDGADEKIFAIYEMEGHPDNTIWIITEHDRSTTKIMYGYDC